MIVSMASLMASEKQRPCSEELRGLRMQKGILAHRPRLVRGLSFYHLVSLCGLNGACPLLAFAIRATKGTAANLGTKFGFS